MTLKLQGKNVREQFLYFFIILFMSHRGLLTLFAILFGYSSQRYRYVKYCIFFCLVMLICVSIKTLISRIRIDAIILYFILFLLSLWTYLFGSGAKIVFEEENLFTEVFIFSISGFLLCKEVRDYELFLSILKKYSYFIVSISGVVLLFARVGSAYMGFSYAILLYILTLLYYGFFKGDKAAFIAGIIGSLIDIAGGTRGSLLCLFALFIGFLIFSKKWKICIVLCFSVLLIALNINPIVNLLYSITTSLGISSRILEALLGTNMSSISFTNGRTTITNIAFDLIKENTLGYGYLGERAYLNDRVWWFTTDGYAHNIFLEIILQFGIFFGFLLIVALIYLIFNFAIKFNANNAAFSIGIIYMCYCVHLMVSRSYTTTFEFWFLLGLLLQYNWKKLKFGGTSTWSI